MSSKYKTGKEGRFWAVGTQSGSAMWVFCYTRIKNRNKQCWIVTRILLCVVTAPQSWGWCKSVQWESTWCDKAGRSVTAPRPGFGLWSTRKDTLVSQVFEIRWIFGVWNMFYCFVFLGSFEPVSGSTYQLWELFWPLQSEKDDDDTTLCFPMLIGICV